MMTDPQRQAIVVALESVQAAVKVLLVAVAALEADTPPSPPPPWWPDLFPTHGDDEGGPSRE